MNKKKVKLIIMLVPLLLSISILSGCIAVNAIQTKHWDHINTEGTGVRLWGFLILAENFNNWDGYFVYDIEKHDNWELYEHRVEADYYGPLNTFSVDIYDLDRTTTYHYRAVGEQKAQGSTIRVGVDLTFVPGGPRVEVKAATNIGTDSATLVGELTHMGGDDDCKVFFRYGTDINNLNMETEHETLTSTGDFSHDITGLSSCQPIYYKAIAVNDADTWASVFTLSVTPGLPNVETYLPNDVTSTSALYRGELFNLGGPSSCEVWFEYGDENPNQLDEKTDPITLTASGEFDIVCDVLNPGTTYWVRAVANNGLCEDKGLVKEFRTIGFVDTNVQTIEKTIDQKSLIKTRILSYLQKRLNINEETLNALIKQYPMIEKILK